MSWKNYTGYLAVANPNNPSDYLQRSVYLIANHSKFFAVGVCINKIQENTDLASVSHSLGINYYKNDPIYDGGDRNANKINIVHSLDWKGIGTVPLNDEIGITHDISILMALAENEGPRYYKSCAGFGQWENGSFEKQLSKSPTQHKWEILPATLENVFLIEDDFLWEHCIQSTIIKRVQDFF